MRWLLGWVVAAAAVGAVRAQEVVVNGRALSAAELQWMAQRAGVPLPPGRWWYDARSGLWGPEGAGAAGFAPPGLPVAAPLPADASRGRAGVFINGRSLSDAEIRWLQTLGPVLPGRYWLDAQGHVGVEGHPVPFTNLGQLVQARAGGSHGSATPGGTYGSATPGGAWIAGSGGCVVISARSSTGIGSFGASNC